MSRSLPQTAYKALAAELRTAILEGQFLPNEQLPTEAVLTARHHVSRQTVRQAFKELVSESLVYRVQGRGTFAAPIANGTYLRSFGSIDDLMALSEDTTLEVVKPLRICTDASAAGRLQLSSDQVMTGQLRRTHGGLVFCSTVIYMPVDIGRNVAKAKELRETGTRSAATVIGLVEHLAAIPIAGAHQSVMAVRASAEVAQLIGCEPEAPVLQIDRLYYDRSGRSIELAVTHFHPDRYSYRLEIRRSPY